MQCSSQCCSSSLGNEAAETVNELSGRFTLPTLRWDLWKRCAFILRLWIKIVSFSITTPVNTERFHAGMIQNEGGPHRHLRHLFFWELEHTGSSSHKWRREPSPILICAREALFPHMAWNNRHNPLLLTHCSLNRTVCLFFLMGPA